MSFPSAPRDICWKPPPGDSWQSNLNLVHVVGFVSKYGEPSNGFLSTNPKKVPPNRHKRRICCPVPYLAPWGWGGREPAVEPRSLPCRAVPRSVIRTMTQSHSFVEHCGCPPGKRPSSRHDSQTTWHSFLFPGKKHVCFQPQA